jgi:hypothetical protein
MSSRISSWSSSTSDAPHSTSHSQAISETSVVQPTGQLNTYRMAIWARKARKMTASSVAATASATRWRVRPARCSIRT